MVSVEPGQGRLLRRRSDSTISLLTHLVLSPGGADHHHSLASPSQRTADDQAGLLRRLIDERIRPALEEQVPPKFWCVPDPGFPPPSAYPPNMAAR